jgi:7,8-didemethyl-8-hydroxy-5-deazariboflavin synthase CofH subunit
MSSPLDLRAALAGARPDVRAILEPCLEGRELDVERAVLLCTAQGPDLEALRASADALRREQAGDEVAYVVNRNINFTNVCVKACTFCAFARNHRSEKGYFLDRDEVLRRAVEARDLGATEVCLQAGLAPGIDGRLYVDLCRAVKAAAPELHLHAFSPEEVKYGAALAGVPIRAYLEELKDAGLGSLPGTSAEVLDDGVRDRIAPGRITTAEWIDVIRTAHSIGLPTTSTLMFGHVETDVERMRHLDLLRSIQKETGGFTEFVPLSFVHREAPMYLKGLLPDVRPGPTGDDVTRLFALARLMLGATFKNLQASWVKEGLDKARELLSCGANDLGGTLMNESISTAAGAGHGQLQTPRSLREAIRAAGRVPVQRDTKYRALRRFAVNAGVDAGEDAADPLDALTGADAEATFGSYASVARDERYRFKVTQIRRRAPS